MVKRKGLGKGLEALLSEDRPVEEPVEEKVEASESGVHRIQIDAISARDEQPRQSFREETLEELSESIKRHGILQPLVVTKDETGYTLIAGERRLRAAIKAGLTEVPVSIIEATPQEIAEISLVENIQREDLGPVEEANAYEELMTSYGYTQQELAERVGKSRSYVANAVRLLKLDDISLHHLRNGDITSGQARALLSVQRMADRRKMLDKLLSRKASIRTVERTARRQKQKDIYEEDAENALMERLGTKVQIIPRKKGGKIEVEYYNAEDLERIIELLSDQEEE